MTHPGFFDGEYRDLDGFDPPTVDEDFEALGEVEDHMSKRRRNEREIQAIPTEYAGVQFRSRFEANTAQQFDACGWKWEYESASFLLPGGHYRPDFHLPDLKLWLECRGYPTEPRSFLDFGRKARHEMNEHFVVLSWSGIATYFTQVAQPCRLEICISCRSFWMDRLFEPFTYCPRCGLAQVKTNESLRGADAMFGYQEVVVTKEGVIGSAQLESLVVQQTPFTDDRSYFWTPLGEWHTERLGELSDKA